MIGIAVIGLGNAFEPHAKALLDLRDRAQVVWATAPRDARPQAVAQKFGFPTTTDIAKAMADDRVDAILVLTPTNAHLPIARGRLRRRQARAVRKAAGSLARTRGERLIAAGRRAGRKLGVVLQLRFRAGSQRLKQVLDDGLLGAVQAASMSVPWWRPQSYYDQPGRGVKARDGGGVLMIQAIHTLDLFRWCFGVSRVEAAQVRTTALHRMETEDYVAALVRLGNDAPGTIVATVAAYPGSPERIDVIGTLGTARLEGGSLRLSFLDGREEMMVDDSGSGSGANVMAFSHEPHKAVISDFLDAVEAGSRSGDHRGGSAGDATPDRGDFGKRRTVTCRHCCRWPTSSAPG